MTDRVPIDDRRLRYTLFALENLTKSGVLSPEKFTADDISRIEQAVWKEWQRERDRLDAEYGENQWAHDHQMQHDMIMDSVERVLKGENSVTEETETKERIQPVADEERKVYTFAEWVRESLVEVDPGVTVEESSLNRLDIKLNGEWHVATIYAPPEGLLQEWLDAYPRQMQTEMFRRIIFGINSWCGLATDIHTGEAKTP